MLSDKDQSLLSYRRESFAVVGGLALMDSERDLTLHVGPHTD